MALSKLVNFLRGVIQGSSIGPLMFLIHIDGFAKLLKQHGITTKLSADDVKVYTIIKNDLDVVKLQTGLDKIADWANDLKQSVSVAKCSVLKMSRNMAGDVDLRLDSFALPSVTHCYNLGITIAYDLSSIQYTAEIVFKARRTANSILRYFLSGDTGLLLCAYIMYAHPLVECNSIIWSQVTKHDIDCDIDTDIVKKVSDDSISDFVSLGRVAPSILNLSSP